MRAIGILLIAVAFALGMFSTGPGVSSGALMAGAALCLIGGIALLAFAAYETTKQDLLSKERDESEKKRRL